MASKLFSQLEVKSILFRNRIALSPMCQYSATDGFASEWHFAHYGSRAAGGAGLIVQEASAVSEEGRITPGDLGIYLDEHIVNLKRITNFVREQGSIAGIQLAHAGRKASCEKPWRGGKQIDSWQNGWQTIAPSPIPFNNSDIAPVVLDEKRIQMVISHFKAAACRALEAGYQVVEIHAAHGYLIHQFLSPVSNHRSDIYGGSFENRIRLLLEIVDAVKSEWPDELPLFVRISATDWVEGGWNITEAVKLCSILKTKGVDLIDCSSGGLVPWAKIPFAPGYQVDFASQIRNETGIMTGAVGLITNPIHANEILEKDYADLILIGREYLRDPHFVLNSARLLNEDIEWPPQYLRAKV